MTPGRVFRRSSLVVALAVVAAVALAAACGGGGGGAGGAEEVVTRWMEGWQRTSGISRDDLAAGEIRLLLTGDLRARTEGVRVGGSGAQSGGGRGLPRLYNDFMLLPFPPDTGFSIVSTEAEGDVATVVVALDYSDAAAGRAAASGLIEFSEVQSVHELVIQDPTRTFRLVKVEGDWKIDAITE
jgi:hypothetical protein